MTKERKLLTEIMNEVWENCSLKPEDPTHEKVCNFSRSIYFKLEDLRRILEAKGCRQSHTLLQLHPHDSPFNCCECGEPIKFI